MCESDECEEVLPDGLEHCGGNVIQVVGWLDKTILRGRVILQCSNRCSSER